MKTRIPDDPDKNESDFEARCHHDIVASGLTAALGITHLLGFCPTLGRVAAVTGP